jgi:hypothetical protein
MQPEQASRADAIRRWTDYLEWHFLRSAFALPLNNSTAHSCPRLRERPNAAAVRSQ